MPLTTKPTFTIRADGTPLIGGKPTLLWGGYTVSWAGGVGATLRDIDTAAALGWNVLSVPWIFSAGLTGNQAILDYAAQKDLMIIIGDVEAGWAEQNSMVNNHPAVIGIGIADDANNYTLSQLQGYRTSFNTYTPALIKFMSMASGMSINGGTSLNQHVAQAQMVGNQTYPIPYDPLMTIITEQTKMVAACAAASPQGIASADLDWQTKAGGLPIATPQQLEVQAWLALIAGVKSVMWYALTDQYNRNSGKNAHLDALRDMRGRVRSAEPFLLNGTRSRITHSDPYTVVGRWVLGATNLTVIVNTSASPRWVSAAIPAGTTAHTGPLKVSASRFAGELPAFGVALMRST